MELNGIKSYVSNDYVIEISKNKHLMRFKRNVFDYVIDIFLT
jgi:hypothetical protein